MTRDKKRSKAEVLRLRQNSAMGGCCDRFADQQACDCLEKATDGREPTLCEPPSIYGRPIQEHGGGKYLRTIHSADGNGGPIKVDVYCVIEAFRAHCPALNKAPMQHALKKLLCCGVRGKGTVIDDMHGIFEAMWRALELQKQEEAEDVG